MLQDLCRRMGTMYTKRTKESSSRRNAFAEAIYLAIGLFPPLIIGSQAGNAKSLVHMHRAFALSRWFTSSRAVSITRIVPFPSKKQSINFCSARIENEEITETEKQRERERGERRRNSLGKRSLLYVEDVHAFASRLGRKLFVRLSLANH